MPHDEGCSDFLPTKVMRMTIIEKAHIEHQSFAQASMTDGMWMGEVGDVLGYPSSDAVAGTNQWTSEKPILLGTESIPLVL